MSLDLSSLPLHLAALSCGSTQRYPHTAAISPDGTLLAWADSSQGLSLASVCQGSQADSHNCAGSLVRRGDPSGDEALPSRSSSEGLSVQRHAAPAPLGSCEVARLALTNKALLVAKADGSLAVVDFAEPGQVRVDCHGHCQGSGQTM